jgi:hypothetical protein
MLFEVLTPLGFTVRTTAEYWRRLVVKHPDLADRLEDVKTALRQPEQVRQSRRDPTVLLFYRRGILHWVVAVTKRADDTGFLVTAYQTDAIKEGESIWPR